MAKKNQHVVPLGNGWAVKGEGNSRFTAITERKREATIIARDIARNNRSEVVIHGKDGKIQDKDSYGNDSNSIKDKVH
jgi:hypothetical protein